MTVPRAPSGLQMAGRRLWKAVMADYDMADWQLVVLRTAAESADRIAEARAAIAAEGLTVAGRFGPRAHPACAIERDSRIALLRALRELALDPGVVEEVARPPLIHGRYARGG